MVKSAEINFDSINVEITNLLRLVEGDVSVFFYDFNTNRRYMLNENEPFNTASLMKVLVGLQLVRLFETGKLEENATIKLKNSFASKHDNSLFHLSETIDGEKSLYSRIGLQVSVLELLELMITQSSNLATNNLFELIENKCCIADLLAELLMTDTKIVRGVEDQKAYDAGMINTTTAVDLVKLFQHIHNGVSTGNKSITLLYEIMKRQEHNSIIPSLLPKNLHIAHKTGTLKSTIHDAALISSDEGKNYILILLSKNLQNKALATTAFAKISEVFYNSASEKTKII
jgi:beta-lactamase class A